MSVARIATLSTMLALLAGCSAFDELPLPRSAALPLAPAALTSELPDGVVVDLSNGLGPTELAAIAVMTNPALNAQRKQMGVADAQLFATRLFPDPQFGYGVDRPTGDTTGLVDAKSLSLNYDLLSLLTRGPAVRAQRLATDQLRLDLLWQEWQVAQQARILFVRDRQETARLQLLASALENFGRRQAKSAQALAEGNLTINDAGPDLTALLDARSQRRQLEQQHNQTQHDLKALLGLDPQARLELEALPALPAATAATAQQRSAALDQAMATRPDLLALQAGYASQEARIRSAALRFFPTLGVGFLRANDTSNIKTSGLNISLDLPFFSGSRGELRVQKATREQLFAEYQARLAETRSDVSRLGSEQEILQRYRDELAAYVPELERMATEARRAYANQNIDALTYLNLEFSAINKRIELIDLEQSLWEIAIALDTLLAQAPGQ